MYISERVFYNHDNVINVSLMSTRLINTKQLILNDMSHIFNDALLAIKWLQKLSKNLWHTLVPIYIIRIGSSESHKQLKLPLYFSCITQTWLFLDSIFCDPFRLWKLQCGHHIILLQWEDLS